MYKRFIFIGLCALVLSSNAFIAGCSDNNEKTTIKSNENTNIINNETTQSQHIQNKPEANKIEVVPKTNMTLGTDYQTIINTLGEPTNVIMEYKDGFGMVNFKEGYYQATFTEGKLSTLWISFEVTEGAGQGVSKEKANKVVKEILPDDAKLIQQYDRDISPAIGKVDVYKSKKLALQFNKDNFINIEPGGCIAYYKINDKGQVFSVGISLGNNP